MNRDYQTESADLDAEIRAMYPDGNEPDLTPDDNNDLSIALDESNQEAKGAESGMVSAEKYHAAVVAMNKAQQEAASLRKQAQAPAESTPTEEYGEDESSESGGDKLQELRDIGFDEVADYIESVINKRLDAIESRTSGVEGVANDYVGYRQQQHTDAFWTALRESHPNVQEFLPPTSGEYEDYTDAQKEYADWYASQDQDTKDLLSSTDVQTVIHGLDMFKGQAKPASDPEKTPSVAVVVANDNPAEPKPSKIEQAREAASPAISAMGGLKKEKGKFTRDQVDKMSTKEYLDNEQDILAAMQRGEI